MEDQSSINPPQPGVTLTRKALVDAWALLTNRPLNPTAEQWLKNTPIPVAPMKSSAKIVADLMRVEARKLFPEHSSNVVDFKLAVGE